MAKETGPLIENETGDGADVAAVYDLLYRSHSAFETHGTRALERYVAKGCPGSLSIKRSEAWLAPHHALAIAAMYLSLLAGWVFDRFGVERGALDTAQEALIERMGNLADRVVTEFVSRPSVTER